MRSTGRQLLLTLLAAVAALAFFLHRGLPPRESIGVAVQQSDHPALRRCAAWGVSFRELPRYSDLPLIFDAMYAGGKTLEVLVELGADVNEAPTGTDSTPLIWAVYLSDPQLVRRLLDLGADPSRPARDGITPLHTILLSSPAEAPGQTPDPGDEQRTLAIATLLIDAGADINARWDGTTPLHLAAQCHHSGVVRLLVERGAEVNVRNREGETPLAVAVREELTALADLLRRHGARE